jgi:hypothetical protein
LVRLEKNGILIDGEGAVAVGAKEGVMIYLGATRCALPAHDIAGEHAAELQRK